MAAVDTPAAQVLSRPWRLVRLSAALILTGLGAGLGGMFLAMLLHGVQHLAFGYGQDSLSDSESFLIGVSSASPERRLLVLMLCGLVAGIGWWLLYRFGRPLVSVKRAVSDPAASLPAKTTLVHVLLQIVSVGLGSPLGREVAPRELGALVGNWLGLRAGLDSDTRRLLIACGAGAGLAAVYNVPLGGAVLVLEVLLLRLSLRNVLMALSTSAIGASVAWIGLGAQVQYQIPQWPLSLNLILFAVLSGPLFGVAAYGFVRLTSSARQHAARGWQLPLLMFLNFSLVGALAMFLPQILGNGKGPAQLGFDGQLGLGLAAVLLVAKVVVTSSTLRAGAEGGLLTPGLAIGALLAIVLGSLWGQVWPGVALGAFAIVGAAAFLGASMKMPLTAVVLVAEFTRIDHDFLVPIILCVVGSVAVCRLCEGRNDAQ